MRSNNLKRLNIFQGTPILSSCITSSQNAPMPNLTHIQGPPGNLTPHPITIQLPTQPQPIQAVKTVTYVSSPRSHGTSITSTQPPVRLAYTTSGENPWTTSPIRNSMSSSLWFNGTYGLNVLPQSPQKLIFWTQISNQRLLTSLVFVKSSFRILICFLT